MKGLFAYKGNHYVGRVVESEMGKLDGYPQKFVTVLMPDGTVETKKDTSWRYTSADEVIPVKKEQVDELHRRLRDLQGRHVKEGESYGIELSLDALGLLGLA